MKHEDDTRSYWEKHYEYVPYLTYTQVLEATPVGLVFEVDIDEENGEVDFFPEDNRLDMYPEPFMRDILFSSLKEKTTIPHDLIDKMNDGKYQYSNDLALMLRHQLNWIIQIENSGKGPNVVGSLTRSEISFFACDMLQGTDFANQMSSKVNLPIPLNLIKLFESLLGSDKTQLGFSKQQEMHNKRRLAVRFKIGDPYISIREIARKLDINPSTISRWFNKKDAKEFEQNMRKSFEVIYNYWANSPEKTSKDVAQHLGIDEQAVLKCMNGPFHESFMEKFNQENLKKKMSQQKLENNISE